MRLTCLQLCGLMAAEVAKMTNLLLDVGLIRVSVVGDEIELVYFYKCRGVNID